MCACSSHQKRLDTQKGGDIASLMRTAVKAVQLIYIHTHKQAGSFVSHFQLVKPSYLKVTRKGREGELEDVLQLFCVQCEHCKLIISCSYM